MEERTSGWALGLDACAVARAGLYVTVVEHGDLDVTCVADWLFFNIHLARPSKMDSRSSTHYRPFSRKRNDTPY